MTEWPNRDPIEEEGGINLYTYVNNDPVNWIDP
jgi:RHS repeat-associated protein